MVERLARSCSRLVRRLRLLSHRSRSIEGEVPPPAQELQRTPTLDRHRPDSGREERR